MTIAKDRADAIDLVRLVVVGGLVAIVAFAAILSWHDGDAAWVSTSTPWRMGAGAVAVLLGAASGWRMIARTRTGQWQISSGGIAFRGADQTDVAMTWNQVERVRWTDDLVTFVGDPGRIVLERLRFEPADWSAVRGRIAAALASRFDLAPRTREAVLFLSWRLVVATLVACLLILASFEVALRDPEEWGRLVVGGWLLILIGPLILAAILAIRDERRSSWRYPGPELGGRQEDRG